MLAFRILGPLEAMTEHGSVRLGGPKQRATLAILLLNANRVVSVDRLADDLYAGAPPVTAVTQVQRQISELRKVLGSASLIETRAPGYVIRLEPDQLDLARFERLSEEAGLALRRGQAREAADLLREALGLWRGEPLADLAGEPFAILAVRRLEEIRLAALEQRMEGELGLGRHLELVPELEQLVAEHPFRERLRGQLMLALYRAGRQAEALDAYQAARQLLVNDLGIEPSPALRELERAILNQNPTLGLESLRVEPDRAVLVVPSREDALRRLVAIAEPLARAGASGELILARLLSDQSQLERAAAQLEERRGALAVPARTAVFTTADAALDIVRLANAYEVELVLVDAPAGLDGKEVPAQLAALLEQSPADLAILAGGAESGPGEGVFVPFGGAENDWAALELGAVLASAGGHDLRLVGTKADGRTGRRDASRLLADASLAVQRLAGLRAAPLLVEATEQALVSAVAPATVVVVGIGSRWRDQGIGSTRRALVRQLRPVVLVHSGPRPGALAPRGTRTRFTWSVAA